MDLITLAIAKAMSGSSGGGLDLDVIEVTSNGVVVFPHDDYLKNTKMFFIKTTHLDTGNKMALCVVSADNNEAQDRDYYANTISEGYVNRFYLLPYSGHSDGEKKYTFKYGKNNPNSVVMPIDLSKYSQSRYTPSISTSSGSGAVLVEGDPGEINSVQLSDLITDLGYSLYGIEEMDLTSGATLFNQLSYAIKTLANSSPGTAVTRYFTLSAELVPVAANMISFVSDKRTKKEVAGLFLGGYSSVIPDLYIANSGSFVTFKYKEVDFTADKIYDITYIIGETKIMIQCTCYEATALS